MCVGLVFFFFSSRRRHTRFDCDWSSDVCSSDLVIPGASKWQIVVNRGVQRWGVPIDKDVRAADVGAGTVNTESLGAPVETLTLKFAPATGNATELGFEWEKPRVRMPIRRTAGRHASSR